MKLHLNTNAERDVFVEWFDDEDRACQISVSVYSIHIHTPDDTIHISGLENRSRFIAALKLTLAALEK